MKKNKTALLGLLKNITHRGPNPLGIFCWRDNRIIPSRVSPRVPTFFNRPLFVLILILTLGAIGVVSCSQSGVDKTKGEISHYTCPMHPHIHADEPGECPICHMTLVPVYKQGTEPAPTQGRGPSTDISPERQQLIGIQTVAVQKKQVTKVLRTVGRVAFDPDLAIAQKEFVEIAKNVPSLKSASLSRLKLMGMSEEEISALEKKGQVHSNLYLPDKNDPVWIYATLYQGEVGIVKQGMKAEISFPSGSDQIFEGVVRSVDPVIDPTTRSARARVEVTDAHGLLRPDTYVNVLLNMDLGEALVVPKSAVIDTGTRQLAFAVHDGRHFESRNISLGPEVGDEIVVLDGLTENEKVVSSAAFLVDSESQLKAAVSGMASAPTCPEGEVWDSNMNMCMPKVGD